MSRTDTRITGDIPQNLVPVGETGLIPHDLRFDTEGHREPNAMGIMDRMMRPDHFLGVLADRASRREDILMLDAKEINLRWQSPRENEPGHFYIEPNTATIHEGSKMRKWFERHKRMKVNDLGYQTACHRINRNTKVFENFENPTGRFLDEFHDWYRGDSGKGLLVRTISYDDNDTNREVDAMLPGNFNPISNYELCAALINRIQECYGDIIRGVQILEDDSLSNVDYRILFGNPVMKEIDYGLDARKILFVMLNFTGSEHGLIDTQLNLGLWRMVCANGAMRQDIDYFNVRWKRFDSESKFLSRSSSVINVAGLFGDVMSNRLANLQREKLEHDPLLILATLSELRLIDKRHAETAELSIKATRTDTNWDMFNILTDSAKTHGLASRRMKAESASLMLAMQPGGFNGIVENGFDKAFARHDLQEVAKSGVTITDEG